VPNGPFWNEPFGASRARSTVTDAAAAEQFFVEGHDRARDDRASA
jgi:hypothetical protein